MRDRSIVPFVTYSSENERSQLLGSFFTNVVYPLAMAKSYHTHMCVSPEGTTEAYTENKFRKTSIYESKLFESSINIHKFMPSVILIGPGVEQEEFLLHSAPAVQK
jgi:hypothetical protein